MSARLPVVVIGGGVVGCSILREFARRGLAGLLVEAEADVCEGTSKANSAIVHTGFDSKPGTLESRMLRRAAELWPAQVDELGVPFLAVGALMLARTAEEAARLESEIAANATALGVRTELLDHAAVRDAAPYLADDVVAALSIPDESVVDPFWLTRAAAESAIAGGAQVRLSARVVGLEIGDDRVVVRLEDGTTVEAEQVVDAAGLRADEVARLAGDDSFSLSPRVGQFLVSEETFGVDRIVLPIPGPLGKGMLVTPIVFGGLLLGPTAVDVTDRDDRGVDPAARDRILSATTPLVPALAEAVPVRQFAGLRHVSSTGDFIVRPSSASDRLYLAAGIRSTGISASPAIAQAVVDDVVALRGWRVGTGSRPLPPEPLALPPEPLALPDDPGPIVCLCRSISRAEVEAACRRPLPPTTLDGVKRRGGATFGDCQGNLCALDVAEIVAAERGIPVGGVEKHRRGSWLWLAPDEADGASSVVAAGGAARGRDGETERSIAVDVAIVGAGRAGRAAAEALAADGRSVAVVDRSAVPAEPAVPPEGRTPLRLVAGATVVGLGPTDDGWLVLAQDAEGSREVTARHVLVATGGYVEPREHRAVAGPRSSGVMTADLARRLLRDRFLPGREIALVGANAVADELADELADAGARVVRLSAPPDAVRGDARLTGVGVEGAWVDADTLVLADRLLPQAFLLRGLGLLDGRPGTPAPAAPDGRLPLDGLWAAGCCVAPTWEHEGCADDGRRVGEAIAAALAAGGAGSGGVEPATSGVATGSMP